MGVFIISPLPPLLSEELRTAGPLRSTDVTPSQRYYEPLRHPLVVSRLPGAAGYTAYPASALSGRDEEGFSRCSTCPGRRAVANHPAGATRRVDRFAPGRTAFALTVAGSASGFTHFRGHLSFTFVTARTTRTYPTGRVVEGLQHHRFPSGLPSSYGATDSYPGRSISCWTHQPFLDAQPDGRLSPH